MIASNLGLPGASYQPAAPRLLCYLQPALFVLPFLPMIVLHWRRIDSRLKAVALTLTPLLLLSSLCFGWLYESRNYMPLLPLLATMALPVGRIANPSYAARSGCIQSRDR